MHEHLASPHFLSIESANIPWREWQLIEVTGKESLNALYEYKLTLACLSELPLAPLLGRSLKFSVGGQPYSGLVIKAEEGKIENARYHIELTLAPKIWQTTLEKHSRVFEHQSVLDIFDKVLQAYVPLQNSKKLIREYASLDYAMQYQETNFEFLSRILYDAGISFYFEQTSSGEAMVLFDDIACFPSLENFSRYKILEEKRCWGSPKVISKNRDWQSPTPAKPLRGNHYCYYSHQTITDYYETALQVMDHTFTIEFTEQPMAFGKIFQIKPGCFLKSSEWIAREDHFLQNAQALPTSTRFCAAPLPCPPLQGLHLARVTEAEKQELSLKSQGLISIQYPWDDLTPKRLHRFRALEMISGDYAGTQFYPRAEQAVIVDHIEGHPSEAVILASHYGLNQPLPAAPSMIGMKSHLLQNASQKMGHQIYFDDDSQNAQAFLYSQKDYQQSVEGDAKILITGTRHADIQGNYHRKVLQGELHQTARKLRYQVGESEICLDDRGAHFKTPKINLLIKDAPAAEIARVNDAHTCPASTSEIPHQGGPILEGISAVTANGQAIATLGDEVQCHGPSDEISEGIANLLIHGKPAAYLGAKTAHGGKIISASKMVVIGPRARGE